VPRPPALAAPKEAAALERADALAAGALFVVGTLFAAFLFMDFARAGRPMYEDEFAYWFQAQTFASGHVSFPSPPMPEFFEAPHLLVVPRYAAKYFPGHAALLAPFFALHLPWLGPSLLLGANAALIFLALRLSGVGRRVALPVLLLLLFGSSEMVSLFGSYLSQTTTTFLVSAFFAVAAACFRRPATSNMVVLGALCAFGGCTRPYTGVALGAGALVLFLTSRPRLTRRHLFAFALPAAVGVVLLGAYCHNVTGSFTTTPWALYARQYMPYDGLSLTTDANAPPLRALPTHTRGLGERLRNSRLKYSQGWLGEQGLRAWGVVAIFPGHIPALLVLPGVFGAPPIALVAATVAAAYFILQATHHFTWAAYLVELYPSLLLLAGLGLARILRFIATVNLPPLRLALYGCLLLAALLVSGAAAADLGDLFRQARTISLRSWEYEPQLAQVRKVRGLVFIRYPQFWTFNEDLGYNDPDLDGSALVRAIDLGAHDADLMAALPGRPAFLLDAETGELRRLR
jgi:hypothetical protein